MSCDIDTRRFKVDMWMVLSNDSWRIHEMHRKSSVAVFRSVLGAWREVSVGERYTALPKDR